MAFADVYNLNPRPYWLQFIDTGQMFQSSGILNIVGGGGKRYLTLVTPSNRYMHIIKNTAQSVSDGLVTMSIYENPTISVGNLTLPVTNLDRRSSKTSSAIYYYNSNGLSGGTLLSSIVINNNGSIVNAGFLVGGFDEIMLLPNMKYVALIQNDGTITSTNAFNFLWYETDN